MEIAQYIDLLKDLSDTAFTLWGFLLTVSLGIVAFLGSVNRLRMIVSVLLCVTFIGFAFSNYRALERNFEQRLAVIKVINEAKTTDVDLNEQYSVNKPIIDSFQINQKRLTENGLNFQVLVSAIVSLLILIWPITQLGLTKRSSK